MAREGTGTAWPSRLRISRTALIAFGIAAAVLAAVVWRIVASEVPRAEAIRASGTIEATESDVSPKVQGRLIGLRVKDGDPVKKGEPIATMEQVDPGLNLAQARASVAAARAQVAVAQSAYDLQRDSYSTAVAQANEGVAIAGSRVGQAGENFDITSQAATIGVQAAQAQLAAAQAAYAKAQIDLGRAKDLVATGDEPQQMLDDAAAQFKAASAQRDAARDAVANARSNLETIQVRRLDVMASREQHRQSQAVLENAVAERRLVVQRQAQLLAAKAALAQAQAALGLAADQVRETSLRAPFDGVVISHNFEVGDLIAPGAAVLTVGDLAHPYVYVYVSETDVPKIKTGAHAEITIDGLPGRTFSGTVTEISDTAEFTPENVQTKEERVEYLVFRLKIQLVDSTGTLKPGLPADAVIRV